MNRSLVIAVVATGAWLGGCAASHHQERTFIVSGGEYAAAFSAAKETILSARFELERVDARAGVITTKPKPTSGLATPWDLEQTSLGQELEDLLNRQYRRVRVTFEPEASGDAASGGSPEEPAGDLRLGGTPTRCTVSVVIDRVRRPGQRIETSSIRLSTTAMDPEVAAQGMWPQYAVPIARDDRLASRLASRIHARLREGSTASQPP